MFFVILISLFGYSFGTQLNFKYHNQTQLESFLKDINSTYTDFVNLYSIGKSTNGANLWVLEIDVNKNKSSVAIPNVKLIGNIHGDEPVGRELLLHLIEHLLISYNEKTDLLITWLLNNTKIHILPCLNPDGFAQAQEGNSYTSMGRTNADDIDLDRSFPDYFRKNDIPPAVETQAIQKWMIKIPFVLSASLHDGGLIAIYPYDNFPLEGVLNYKTPDDDVFQHIAEQYANIHPEMHNGRKFCNSDLQKNPKTVNGVIHGLHWKRITGGMQDYNYLQHGCLEITLKISCRKYPYAKFLEKFWKQNKNALINHIKQVHYGVKGVIRNQTDNPVPSAHLKIVGRDITFNSTKLGEFWRILLPGIYELQINATNYKPKVVEFVVWDSSDGDHGDIPKTTFLNVTLESMTETSLTNDISNTLPVLSESTSSTSKVTTYIINETPDENIFIEYVLESISISSKSYLSTEFLISNLLFLFVCYVIM